MVPSKASLLPPHGKGFLNLWVPTGFFSLQLLTRILLNLTLVIAGALDTL